MHPVDAAETQPFGQKNQASGAAYPHTGKDYGSNIGDAVRTIADGEVIYAGWNLPDHLADRFMMVRGSGASGLHMFIQHDGWVELMSHLSAIMVKAGMKVRRGEVVALSGDTGNTQGAHLHYEVMAEPCSPVYPFGRYNPDLQVAHENSSAGISTAGNIKHTEDWDVMASREEIRAEIDAALDTKLAEFKSGIAGTRQAGRTYLDIMGPIKEGSAAAIRAANNTDTLTPGQAGKKHVGRVLELLETMSAKLK